MNAQILANRWHKKGTCVEPVRFSADPLLNKGGKQLPTPYFSIKRTRVQ